jgi:3-oxoadipate enol-lactonase
MMINHQFDGREGAPVLVLWHSIGADLTMWEPQVAPMAEKFHVLRCDSRGHGASSAPTGPYSMADLAGDLLELTRSLGVKRFDMCGLSMGGQVGMWIALHAPERLGRLVIANSAARLGTRDLWDGRIGAVKRAGMSAIVDGAIDRYFSPAFRVRSPALVARAREVFLATQAAGYIGSCAAIRDFDAREQLATIRVPTLIIGGNSDIATPPVESKFLAENIPGAGLVMFPAAHLSNLEAPDSFTAALKQFLA